MRTQERFWVIGGEFECTAFNRLRGQEPIVVGPFESRDLAKAEWKRLSSEHSSRATVRFGIASEEIALAH